MIDIHTHILPGIDDGAANLEESLSMARMAVADGTRAVACTPHIVPGLYNNSRDSIGKAVQALRRSIRDAGIELQLIVGADIHVTPDLLRKLRDRLIPTLNNSRYFLLEPPHHVLPPRLEQLVERLIQAGFSPILTHPERLTWIQSHYHVIASVNAKGCLMQVTAGSLTGSFGKTARYYAERMLEEGRLDVLATDCHNTKGRPPIMSRARQFVEERLGAEEAQRMVFERPARIILNKPLTAVGAGKGVSSNEKESTSAVSALVARLFKRLET